MRSYVGVAVDPTTSAENPEDLLSLEFEGVREVDLGDDTKVTLMLLRSTSDKSPEASFLRSLIAMDGEEESP